MRDLSGKTIIITGASSGIGAATAIECAKAGMNIVLNARRADKLRNIANTIGSLGRKAEVVTCSVTDPHASQILLDAAEKAFGGFYAVFANAGYGMERPMIRMSPAQLREMFEVNFFAGVELLQEAAARLMAAKSPGHLLMCSSCLSRMTLPFHGPYCATKAAQNHICRAMGIELRPHSIHVSSVHPVTTRTEFFDVSAQRSGLADGHPPSSDHSPRLFVQPPERVARAVVKCLRHPRPEVWTSFTARLGAGLMTISPRMGDVVMRLIEKDRREAMQQLRD